VNNPIDLETNEPVVKVETDGQSDDPRIAQFREAFADSEFHLLEPVHPEVNYSFEAMPADPYTLELRADKWWLGENGRVENSSLTLNTYSLEEGEVQREISREEASMEREELLRIYAAQGLETAMHKVEDTAIDNGYLDEDRDDLRLFTEGPEDRFLTQREQEESLASFLDEPPIDLEDTAEADLSDVDSGYEIWELDL
jgi:hypothetical protein